MKDLFWSLVERVFPRLASASLMLLLAVFLTPLEVGLYAWPMVILTLYYSALDSAIRQVAIPSWGSSQGYRLLVRYRNVASIAGVVALLAVLAVLLLVFPSNLHWQIVSMLPVVLVPIANSFSVIPLGYLMLQNSWADLAKMQLLASALSLFVSIPALLLTQSLLGASLQVILVEALFCYQVNRKARGRGMLEAQASLPAGRSHVREFWHASAYSIVGWLQGQADRVFVGAISGTAALGSFSFALAIARNPGDAISASTGNVLRVRISADQGLSAKEVRGRSDHLLIRALCMGIAMTAAIILAIVVVLRPLLGSDWTLPLAAALPAAVSILPTIVSWSLSVVLLAVGRLSWGAPIKAVGIVLALPIALAATWSIELAAWLVLARELIMLILLMFACGAAAPRKAFALCMLGAGLFSAVVYFL